MVLIDTVHHHVVNLQTELEKTYINENRVSVSPVQSNVIQQLCHVDTKITLSQFLLTLSERY